MTDKERIDRLETMVKSLTDTVSGFTIIINNGSYNNNLSDILYILSAVSSDLSPFTEDGDL